MSNEEKWARSSLSKSYKGSKKRGRKKKDKLGINHNSDENYKHHIKENKIKNEEKQEDNFTIMIDSADNNLIGNSKKPYKNINEVDKKNQVMNSTQSEKNNNIYDEIKKCKFI